MQDSNAGEICKGPWAARGAYRAVEDHEALVEVVVLQRGVAVQLGQRVLTSLDVGVVHAAVVQVVAEGSDQQREHLQVRQLALPGRTRRRGREERMVW